MKYCSAEEDGVLEVSSAVGRGSVEVEEVLKVPSPASSPGFMVRGPSKYFIREPGEI